MPDVNYSDWLTIGAMAIAIIAAWYAQRQATAAETANREAKEANNLTRKINEQHSVRWQTTPLGSGRYMLSNIGWAKVYDLTLDVAPHMTGGLSMDELAPMAEIEFAAAGRGDIPKPVIIRWRTSRDEGTPKKKLLTTLR